MASIGSLAIKLIADASQMQQSLATAQRSLDGFASAAKGALTSIPFLGGSFAALPTGASGFIKWIDEGMDRIKDMTRLADRLGVSTEALGAIQLAAGPAAEALPKALFHLERQLGNVIAGSQQARDEFARLGLNGQQLAQMQLPQALGVIADRVRSLPDPAERAAAAFSLFSKAGSEMLPLLMRGSAGLQAAGDAMSRTGNSFSRGEAESIMQAGRAMKEIKLQIQGFQTQAAIGLAPLVAAVAEKLNMWITNAGGAQQAFRGLVEAAVSGFADVLDAVVTVVEAIAAAKSTWDTLGNVWQKTKMFSPVGQASMAFDAYKAQQGGQQAPEPSSLRGFIDAMRQGAKTFRNAGQGGLGQGLISEEVVKTTRALQEELNTFGLDAQQKRLWQLANEGASASQLRLAQSLTNTLDVLTRATSGPVFQSTSFIDDYQKRVEFLQQALKGGVISAEDMANAMDKLNRELEQTAIQQGQQLFQQLMTPLERYNAELDRLQGLLELGAISQETFVRALEKANDELEKANGIVQATLAPSALKGSKEAADIAQNQIAASIGSSGNNPAERAAKLQEAIETMSERQKRMADGIDRLVDNSRDGPVIRIANR